MREYQKQGITLTEILVAFQKTLARANNSAAATRKWNPQILGGEKSLYAVQSLSIDLSCGISIPTGALEDHRDHIFVDLEAKAEERSMIRFQVQAKPVEEMKGTSVSIASYPEPDDDNTVHVIVVVVPGPRMSASVPVRLTFLPYGKVLTVQPDPLGRVSLTFDREGLIEIVPRPENPFEKYLGGPANQRFLQARVEDAVGNFIDSEIFEIEF